LNDVNVQACPCDSLENIITKLSFCCFRFICYCETGCNFVYFISFLYFSSDV